MISKIADIIQSLDNKKMDVSKLLEQLKNARKEIKTDSFSMSIGEIINLYKDGDLELTPAYQRLFRWNEDQKSKFIESILLGIPLPPIFVAQKDDSTWSVVDGLQRLSTILQLTGDLKIQNIENGELELQPPLKLTTTKKLPALDKFTWSHLPSEIQRTLKRSKLGINIILTENSIQAQYELFQRLNTGGLHLSAQEIRNCLIIMLNNSFYEKLDQLKLYKPFKNTVNIKDEKLEIEYHMELILRFFISKRGEVNFSDYSASDTLLSDFVDVETTKLVEDDAFILDNEIKTFKRTFDYLNSNGGKDIFRKYNSEAGKFTGAFLLSSFEAITSGVANNIEEIEKISKEDFLTKVKRMYDEPDFQKYAKRGTRVITRIKGMMEFSNRYFGNEAT